MGALDVVPDVSIDLRATSIAQSCIVARKESPHKCNIVMGDLRSLRQCLFVLFVNPRKIVVVDDGMFTLEVLKFFPDAEYINNRTKKFLIHLFNTKYSARIVFSTIYYQSEISRRSRERGLIVEENNVFEPQVKPLRNLLLIAGMDVVELGILSMEHYEAFIVHVAGYYWSNNLKVAYYPHRSESDRKLSLLKEKYDIEIIERSGPIEEYLISNEEFPATIATLYSSAAINIRGLAPEISVRCIKVLGACAKYQGLIESVYRYLETFPGIQNESIDIDD